MKQPLSRNSFDRRRGYLGVYLQEGAPLVDALWNEGSDLAASLLGDALVDAGVQGTSGLELRIDPVLGDGQLLDLLIRGGAGHFYCGGLPVSWPEDKPFSAQSVDQLEHLAPGWVGQLPRGRHYHLYLEAWVEAVDALDRPDLDDPALSAERGSFRTRVRARVRLGPPGPLRSNLLLTVQGSYVDDRNLHYRVDLVEGVSLGDPGQRAASILWDDANAALMARVAEHAPRYAHTVTVSDSSSFTPGTWVRFEGPEVDPSIYEVTGQGPSSITVRRHVCRERVVSLDRCKVLSVVKVPQPAPQEDQWVLEVEDGGADGPVSRLRPGDRVKELPADASQQLDAEALKLLRVASVARAPNPADAARITLAPDGLAAGLEPWNETRASTLAFPAHPFHSCIEVAARPAWTEGMRVRIHAQHVQHEAKLEFHDQRGPADCAPGAATVDSWEDRRVVRIIRHRDCGTMTLRLDRPLAFEHGAGDRVVPERLIRARRYQGHECAVRIDAVDPRPCPSQENHEGPYELSGSFVLPTGLSLRLSIDARADDPPGGQGAVLVPGDGWSFVARAGGWVEAPVFAPVDETGRSTARLAELTLHEEGGYQLVDLRPVPAPRAHHAWLAEIAEAADEIGREMAPGAAIAELARCADGMRAQRELVGAIRALVPGDEPPEGGGVLQRALASLWRSLERVLDPEAPEDSDLSRIAAAMTRLAGAICCGGQGGAEEAKRRTPEREPKALEPKALEPKALEPKALEPKALEPKAPEPKAPEPKALEPKAPPRVALAIAALPSRLLRPAPDLPSKHVAEVAAEWPTLGDVPAAGGLANKRKRRFAEAVAALLTRTAELGSKAGAPGADRAALSAGLEALWRESYDVGGLEQPLDLDSAIAFAASRSGGES